MENVPSLTKVEFYGSMNTFVIAESSLGADMADTEE